MLDVAAKPMPKTLFIGLGAYGAHGGIQRFNRRVVDALARLGVPAKAIMIADKPADLELTKLVLPTLACDGNRWRFLGRFCISALSADMLLIGHINLLPFAILFRMMRPRARVVMFAHGIEVWGNPEFRARKSWEPFVLRIFVNKIAVVSRYSRGEMMRAFRQKLSKFEHFPNAVDIIPASQNPCENNPSILCVSRLAESEREKNVDKLILAMPHVIRVIPNAKLRIVGKGILEKELSDLAKKIGIDDHIELMGSVNDEQLAQAYAQATVFALPSSKEGFGIVYLEAWLRGLPVVGSVHGAAAEVIDDARDGILVEPSDISAIADALVYLIKNPNHANMMAAFGRQKVINLYSGEAFDRNVNHILAARSTQ